MTEHTDDKAHLGAHLLMDAERLLERAEGDPAAARPAAVAALEALLLEWGETPGGERVADLLDQASRTDETLADFIDDARALDQDSAGAAAYERAKVFVDAARGRLVNI
jgi:HEPN domain-containing protein